LIGIIYTLLVGQLQALIIKAPQSYLRRKWVCRQSSQVKLSFGRPNWLRAKKNQVSK